MGAKLIKKCLFHGFFFSMSFQTCEIQAMQKESDKLKEEISAKDFKIKWTQNKLNAEMELHKVSNWHVTE